MTASRHLIPQADVGLIDARKFATILAGNVALEDLGFADARHYGLPLTSVTVLAALSAIGSLRCMLALLPYREQTQWHFDEPVIIPPHVTLYVTPAVTLAGAAPLTIHGLLLTWRSDWYQGTGQVILTGGWSRI